MISPILLKTPPTETSHSLSSAGLQSQSGRRGLKRGSGSSQPVNSPPPQPGICSCGDMQLTVPEFLCETQHTRSFVVSVEREVGIYSGVNV